MVKWVKELGRGRKDLNTIIVAAYIHDIGWCKILPNARKLTKAELKEYEPLANKNTLPMVQKVLDELNNPYIKKDEVLNLINAADRHKSTNSSEAIIVDADNLSKLNLEHLSEKYQKSDWLKMYELWKTTFPKRIQTPKGKKLYPGLLAELKEAILNS